MRFKFYHESIPPPRPVFWIFLFSLLWHPFSARAETIRVPHDYGSIQLAVNASRNGDVVEVAPGYYFETGIILDKDIMLRSEVPYGAVLDGGGDRSKNLLIVRASVAIEGLVLMNAGFGIIQRDSPDVSWTGRNLAVFNCHFAAVSINDREHTVGSADLSNIIIMDCQHGINTNDAGRMTVRRGFIANCPVAFGGTNHLRFSVDEIITWRCGTLKKKGFVPHLPEANNRIETGGDIYDLDTLAGKYVISDLLFRLWKENISSSPGGNHQTNGKGMIFNRIGNIFSSLHEPERAEFWYGMALETGQELNIPGIAAEALYHLARVAETTGRPQEALRYYCRAAAELEKERSEFTLLDERMYYLNNHRRIYENLLNLLHSLYTSTGKEPYKREAFQICEKTKARSFFDLLNQARLSSPHPVPESLLHRKKHLLKKISEAQAELNKAGRGGAEKRKLYQELRKIEKQYRLVLVEMKKILYPEGFLLPQPHQAEYIQENLPPGTAVVEYFLGEEHAFAFLVTSNRIEFIRLTEPSRIDRWVKNYHLFLTMPDTGEFKGRNGGARLFQALLGPFGDEVFNDIRNLIIVPCGRLTSLPFETLVCRPGEGRDSGYLLHCFRISYAGSASTYVDLKNAWHPEKPRRILAVSGGLSQEIMETYPQSGYFRMERVPELKYSTREINSIRSLLGKENTHLLSGPAALESRIKSMTLSDYKILHFATHGVVYDAHWNWSSLLFNPKDSGEDGLLRAHEVFDLSLNNELVVLSACRTGQGRFIHGEGILGFIQAFHSAGAKAVISSLWNINDLSTSEFMRYFYGFLSEGFSISHALTAAKKEMLASRFSHPYYWAAFLAHGDCIRAVF
ncbi:MAG: CHAT domain-containing tetratricopeptide repeat protein [Candidatus Aminicenantes bacterium]